MQLIKKREISILVLLSFIFGLFTLVIYYSGADYFIQSYFNSTVKGMLFNIFSFITWFGGKEGIIFISLIVSSVFILYKKYKEFLFYLLSVSGATLLNYELKDLFQRERPEIYGTEFAFPSGHAMASIVVFGALALILWPKNKKLAIGLLVFPLLIGFSRVYLDLHWVSDIFGGFAFGAIWLAITFYLFYGWKK